MDRQIVCVAIPSFEVALGRLNDPELRTRPLAIAPLNTSRALLREVSLEAMQDGLYVGCPSSRPRGVVPLGVGTGTISERCLKKKPMRGLNRPNPAMRARKRRVSWAASRDFSADCFIDKLLGSWELGTLKFLRTNLGKPFSTAKRLYSLEQYV